MSKALAVYIPERELKSPKITLLMVSRRAVNDVRCALPTQQLSHVKLQPPQIKQHVVLSFTVQF